MMTLAERIYEILSSDEYIPIRDALKDRELLEAIQADAHPEDLPYECMEWGFTFGVIFALAEPEPLEPLRSVAARARKIAGEVRELDEQGRERVHLRMAAERGERLEKASKAGAA